MRKVVDVDQTRSELRHCFHLWNIDPSEFEILWEESKDNTRRPGAIVRYMHGGKWQTVACYAYLTRAKNLRQVFLLIDRLRLAEQDGVQYQGLASSTDLVAAGGGQNEESLRKEATLDALDVLGVGPDDPVDLIKDIYRKKSMYYHPDKGGTDEKFKRLKDAYELIMNNRGQKP